MKAVTATIDLDPCFRRYGNFGTEYSQMGSVEKKYEIDTIK